MEEPKEQKEITEKKEAREQKEATEKKEQKKGKVKISSMGFTYAKAGVNVAKEKIAYAKIGKILKDTMKHRKGKFGDSLTAIGHYAGLIDIGGGKALAMHADGVGTKVMLADILGKHDTVGIDCIAMNVNDIICMGAEPVAFMDYLAVENLDSKKIEEITKGLAKGASLAGVSVVGGETALMPDVVKGFDLAGMSIGVVDKKDVIDGRKVRKGDVIIGLESSGIHSNGLTMARKLFEGQDLRAKHPELGRSLGEELLEPTRIYVKPVMEIIKKCDVHGLAHITGGAFSKIARIGSKGIGFDIESLPDKPIFRLMQKTGNVADREMYRTFNMGVGFVVVLPKKEAAKALTICRQHWVPAKIIGKVTDTGKVIVKGVDVSD